MHCPGPKGLGVKTQKQLAAETLQERHKSDLDGGCILSRQEEPPDPVMFSALYSSVNMEMEMWWKEKEEEEEEDGQMTENKICKGRPTEERNVGQRTTVVKSPAKKKKLWNASL